MIVLVAIMAWLCTAAAYAEPLSVGERIYIDGVLPSGRTLAALVQGDVPMNASQATCAGCHRRSGLGSSEAGRLVPSLTAGALFRPRDFSRRELPGVRTTLSRPAYTDASLLRAVREGVDSSGRPLSPLMPRYALSDEEAQPLIAYLRTLGAASVPGVERDSLHFATVIAPGAGGEGDAVTEVLEAYFGDKNARTRNEADRFEHPPWTKATRFSAYRRWHLHVWRLEGDASTWQAQLDAKYAERPVFAVVGGTAAPWEPVHAFCETQRVPCIFPWADAPAAEGRYGLYFSTGAALEALAVAEHMASDMPRASAHVVASEPARAAFIKAAPKALSNAVSADVLVILEQPSTLPDFSRYRRIYLGSAAGELIEAVDPAQRASCYLIHPYRLPDDGNVRLKVWLAQHGIAAKNERVQGASLAAAMVSGEALMHVGINFSREYFIERIEHAVTRMPLPSPFPRLSLGPEQRHAAKGVYVVRADDVPAFAKARWLAPASRN